MKLWVWRAATLALLLMAGALREARAEAEEVDCATLERISLADPGGYDVTLCWAGAMSGRATGAYGGNVGSAVEVILALNRATFVLVRFDAADSRTFMQLPSVRAHLEGILAEMEPRSWGEERRHGRFALAPMEAKVTADSPHLNCIGFLSRLRPDGQAPGYREALGGLYCAMDRLVPTESEIAAFLDGLEF